MGFFATRFLQISRTSVIFIVLVVLAVIGVLCTKNHWSAEGKVLGESKRQVVVPPPPAPKAQVPPKGATDLVRPSEAQLSLATVKKNSGKSTEWALIRQIVADPRVYGFSGDLNDKAKIKQWAGVQAHVAIIECGKYDQRFGAQIRTKGGVAYIFQKGSDGRMSIAEYTVMESSKTGAGSTTATYSLAVTHTLAPTVAASHFSGASPTTGALLPVPPYEYVFLG